MDYFTELLESYSRLKKRELVLLEKKEKKAKKKPKKKEPQEKKKPDKVIEEYTREQVIVAALKTPVSWPPYDEASFHPIPGLLTKDEEGNETEVFAYQRPPAKRKKGEEGGIAPIQRAGTTWGATSEAAPRAQTGGAQHGAIIAKGAAKNGGPAVVINADGSPKEPAFENWYKKNFLGKEALTPSDGTGLEAALNRVGESFDLIFTDENIDDSLKNAIYSQLRNMLGIASDLVISARNSDEGFAQKPWAGWKEGEDGKPGRYVGRNEDNSDDPEMTRSVGSYISGRSKKSLEYQLAHGKTVEFDEKVGVIFDELARDPILIQGALDSVQAFMELGKDTLADRETKCKNIGRRVKRKGDRLIFFRNEDPNQGIAIKRSDMFKFVESQIEQNCPEAIKSVPQGEYTPQQLNDMRGKGFEHGAVAVGVIPNLQAMPEGTPDEIRLKQELFRKFAKYANRELLSDESRFSAAYRDLEESEGVALSSRALFVTEAMKQLRIETDTPDKARAFFQRIYDMERPVVDAMKPDFTFPIGLQTGIGYADDLAYAYKDPASAERAADNMGLQKNNAVHPIKVSDLKAELERGEHKELGEIFQAMHNLGDDDNVYLVGSSQKSYFEDGTLKFGETLQRSAAVNGTVDNMAPGFEEVTMQRLGITQNDLDSLRTYQDQLDSIDTALDNLLPKTGTTYKDDAGNTQPINFKNINTMIQEHAVKLSLNSDARLKLESLISDYQGNQKDLNGPDNIIQRAELRNELSRLLTTAKQFQDITQIDPTEEEVQQAKKLAKQDGGVLTAEEIAAKRVRDAKLNLAWTIHMAGGTVRDGVLNKKVFNDNRVRAGSHMTPVNTATLGLINDETGHTLTMSAGMLSLNLNGPNGDTISFGAERSRASGEKHQNLAGDKKGLPVTRNVVNVNVAAQSQDAKIDSKIERRTGRDLSKDSGVRGESPTDIDPVDNPMSDIQANTLHNYIDGQMKLLEELMNKTS